MNNEKLDMILDKYKLSFIEKREILNTIFHIFKHPEFQKRMSTPFFHHGSITLGEHIIEVTVMTYIEVKKYKLDRFINLDLSLKIAMFHDLYTFPWQNNKYKVKHFYNKHGFRHPIEAVINAINWFPESFIYESDKEILIDGIIHHMYPLPVTVIKNWKELELNNLNLLDYLSESDKKIIENSSKRNIISNFSFSKSLYLEGMIVSKADKKVTLKQIKDFKSGLALITGKNKNLK